MRTHTQHIYLAKQVLWKSNKFLILSNSLNIRMAAGITTATANINCHLFKNNKFFFITKFRDDCFSDYWVT